MAKSINTIPTVLETHSPTANEVETVKGVKNVLFGGEGLFLTKLTGPGKVILQTQNFYDFASKIASLIPSNNN